MRAAIVADKKELVVEEMPRPTVGPGQVLLKVQACGVCGTDLHALRGGWQDYPLGHEVSAVVEETGAGVEDVAPGCRVAVECYSRCGDRKSVV